MTTAQLLDAATLMLVGSAEMSPEDFDARLAAFVEESTDKLAALRAVVIAAEAIGAAHKAEAAVHAARVKASAATVERVTGMAGALLRARRELGEDTTVPGVVRLQSNGGKVPLVYAEDFDAAALPEIFQRVKVEADTDAVRAALERGEAVPGVALGERGEGVRWAR